MRNSFTTNIRWLWDNGGEILVVLFFATFAFNIRKVFLMKYSFLNGTYSGFLTPSLRVSDIVIFLLLFIYIIKYLLSQYRTQNSLYLAFKNIYGILSRYIYDLVTFRISCVTFFIILFWLWICFSIVWAPFKPIALYKAFYFTEILIFFALAYKFALNKANIYKHIKWAIIVSGTAQSLIAVSQFIRNGSLGIKLFGESLLGPDIAGVAKITLFGVKHIRSYGTFPHPNILAGFLVVPIFIVIDILFHKIKIRLKNRGIVSHVTMHTMYSSETLFFLILFILISGFILTFSRSAYIGLIIGITLYFLKNLKSKWLYIKHLLIYSALLISITSIVLLVSRNTPNFLFSTQSLGERDLYSEVSREIISKHPFLGVGIGQFVFEEYKLHETFQGWQYQPVHNLYLLITSELGTTGLIIFLILLATLLFRPLRLKKYTTAVKLTDLYYYIIISFIIIAFFDHYFWDIEQGLIIFFIPFLMRYIEEIPVASR